MKKTILTIGVMAAMLSAKAQVCPDSLELVQHQYYCICYAEQHEQAAWVSYQLTKEQVELEVVRVENSIGFRMDKAVSTKTAKTQDYTNSGYERGHLLPAEDMDHDSTAMAQTMFMSNISPQKPYFNNPIWYAEEKKARALAVEYGCVNIVTGPILKDGLPTIGKKSKISVPEAFFKTVLHCTTGDTLYHIILKQ